MALMAEYILFPLLKGCRSPESSPFALEKAVECMQLVLESVTRGDGMRRRILPPSVFTEVLTLVPLLLAYGRIPHNLSDGNTAQPVVTSDEFKLAGIACLSSLFSTDPNPSASINTTTTTTATTTTTIKPEYYAQMITVLIDLAHTERGLQVKLACIRLIHAWIEWIHNHYSDADITTVITTATSTTSAARSGGNIAAIPHSNAATMTLAMFFPGIVSGLTRIIVNTNRRVVDANHQIVVAACRLLAFIIVSVVGDSVAMKENEIKNEEDENIDNTRKETVQPIKVQSLFSSPVPPASLNSPSSSLLSPPASPTSSSPLSTQPQPQSWREATSKRLHHVLHTLFFSQEPPVMASATCVSGACLHHPP